MKYKIPNRNILAKICLLKIYLYKVYNEIKRKLSLIHNIFIL